MAEPTSDWGKELKADLADINRGLSDLDRKSADAAKGATDAMTRILELKGDFKGDFGKVQDDLKGLKSDFKGDLGKVQDNLKGDLGKVQDDLKALQGLKALAGWLGGALALIVLLVGGGNTAFLVSMNGSVNDINRQIGGFGTSVKYLEDTSKHLSGTAKALEQTDRQLGDRLQQLDSTLTSAGQKISQLEKATAFTAQFDGIQRKVDSLDARMTDVREAVRELSRERRAATVRKLRSVSQFRSLHEDDVDRESAMPGLGFRVAIPELVRPDTIEEVSATLLPSTKPMAMPLTVFTLMDEKTGRLLVSIAGAKNEDLQAFLKSPEGLRLSIIYLVRDN